MRKRTYTAEMKEPHEIHQCPKGREILLVYPGDVQYGGRFSEIDDDLILLLPSHGGDGGRLGFPIDSLLFWLLKD